MLYLITLFENGSSMLLLPMVRLFFALYRTILYLTITVLPGPTIDTTPSLLDPDGPWHLEHNLQLPDCSSKINFSTHHEKSNIAISHVLKIMIRVERGDDEFLDSKGKRKVSSPLIFRRSFRN